MVKKALDVATAWICGCSLRSELRSQALPGRLPRFPHTRRRSGPTAQRSRHRDGRDQPGQPPPLLAELQEISLTGPKTINARPGRWQSHVKRELPVCHLSVRMKISGIWKQSHVQSVGDMPKLKSPSQSPRRPILHNATRQVLIAGVSRRDLSLSSARSYARCQN